LPDDPSLPYRLEASFSPAGFMQVAFSVMYGGSEEIVVRSETMDSILRFVEVNGYRINPRLIRLSITGPDGIVEQIPTPKG
jgi:hypothetical protein